MNQDLAEIKSIIDEGLADMCAQKDIQGDDIQEDLDEWISLEKKLAELMLAAFYRNHQ